MLNFIKYLKVLQFYGSIILILSILLNTIFKDVKELESLGVRNCKISSSIPDFLHSFERKGAQSTLQIESRAFTSRASDRRRRYGAYKETFTKFALHPRIICVKT